ncbi:hypothetical protein TRFO_31685 [Tritrichomonas foetus]|uniref:Uncharacterized protein n=1 Tax=Tritrichomonas foetus TaxID=1144522 RepID=A0A1J4JQP7_9EUKA|nr:hypothetical protein TRFO_31685 [Tritrichomonas foetus]|eukprot:OHT01495.1 hypothetical protein TRFO_31685 [Tritrichomonas foetus]
MLYLFFFSFSMSTNAALCGCIVSDSFMIYQPGYFNLIDATFFSVNIQNTFEKMLAEANKDDYFKFGLVLIFDLLLEYPEVDLTPYSDIGWVECISPSKFSTITLKIRENQIKNLTLMNCNVKLSQKIIVDSFELALGSQILTPEQIECRHFNFLYNSLMCHESFDSTEFGIILSENQIETTGASVFNFDFSQINFEMMTFDIGGSYSGCNIEIIAKEDMKTFPSFDFQIEKSLVTTENDIQQIKFSNFENIDFQKVPILSFYTDYNLKFNGKPTNIRIQQFSLERSTILYQDPIFVNEVYICNELCPLDIESKLDRLILYVNNTLDMRSYLLNIISAETPNVFIYTPTSFGTKENPINFIGIQAFENFHILGDLYMSSSGIEYSTWRVNLDDTVSAKNLVVNKCNFNANGVSKMQITNLDLDDFGSIQGRINSVNAFVDFKEFTRLFDSITLENLNIRINVTSDIELVYDTRGWELIEGSTSTIIVLSSSSAVSNNVFFHLFTNGTHKVTLTLRRTDIKTIKGLEFTVYPGLHRTSGFLNYTSSEILSENYIIQNHNSQKNVLKISQEMKNSRDIKDEKEYSIKYVFSRDSWEDHRISASVFIFKKIGKAKVSIDDNYIPNNFEIQFPDVDDESNITTISSEYNETNNEDKDNNFTTNLVVGIVLPTVFIIVGILIFVFAYCSKDTKKEECEENDHLILDSDT